MTYRQNVGMDYFRPIGNINGSLTFDTSNCTRYNKVWSFNKSDILDFLNNGNITNDMLTYPANGNTLLEKCRYCRHFMMLTTMDCTSLLK
ncbi:MAG: hypothetical protein R2829_01325 [Bacteroidia bacterium]